MCFDVNTKKDDILTALEASSDKIITVDFAGESFDGKKLQFDRTVTTDKDIADAIMEEVNNAIEDMYQVWLDQYEYGYDILNVTLAYYMPDILPDMQKQL